MWESRVFYLVYASAGKRASACGVSIDQCGLIVSSRVVARARVLTRHCVDRV